MIGAIPKLYVGNFPYATDEKALQELFEDYGSVKAVRIITDINTGKSKGFAFVEMSSPREASEALTALDRSGFNGRRLRVGFAHPKKDGAAQ